MFEAALEIGDPRVRKATLDKACQGDGNLRQSIDALLKSHETAGSFLDIPAVDGMGDADRNVAARTVVSSSCGDDESDENRVDLSFLKPSTKAGSIGTLGHYEILQILGQGGFGVVFKAFDEKLHRLVAIKVMSPQMAATSPPRKRFLREARSAAAIKHENIVQVYSVEEHPLPYLVMEYIDGETLGQKLDASGPLETAEVLYIGRQIAAGLAAAHAMGLVHRDIKPGNILLEKGPEQKVKIADFELARATDDASLTRSGMICGTPMYMAPEQALGNRSIIVRICSALAAQRLVSDRLRPSAVPSPGGNRRSSTSRRGYAASIAGDRAGDSRLAGRDHQQTPRPKNGGPFSDRKGGRRPLCPLSV